MTDLTIRRMTPDDAETAAYHRAQMFVDMGEAVMEDLLPARQAFAEWAREAIVDERYVGWCAEDDGKIVAGVGLYMFTWPPLTYALDEHPRGHVMNVFTERAYRRQGIARRLMETLIAWSREQGIPALSLNASSEGHSLYESLGFVQSAHPEMRVQL